MAKKALGKGLSALIPNKPSFEPHQGEKTVTLSVEDIIGNPAQPRKSFDAEKLRELAESIREHGLVQPVLVTRAEGGYMLVAGERRWRAAKLAGIKELPAVIRELSPEEIMELALIENIQREDLNPVEEAESYRKLLGTAGYTQERLAERLGKSRVHVANTMRLLSLDQYCLDLLRQGRLSAGHGRALLSVANAALQKGLAKKLADEGLSVRRAEELAKELQDLKAKSNKPPKKQPGIAPVIKAVEDRLRYKLGTKVQLHQAEQGGRIVIEYYDDEDLIRLVELLLPDAEF